MTTRRNFLQSVLAAGAGISAAPIFGLEKPSAADHRYSTGSALPTITPDIPDLAHTLDNGVKVFHLVAEPVKQELIPGHVMDLWGFNGSAPGPTIQVTEGDRVRIVFDNHLPEPTAIHWHGFRVPNEMDGVPGVTQPPVAPGARFIYEFTLNQNGTFFYHSHMAMQEMMGMLGAFIMHPRTAYTPAVDRDFVIHLQEYAVLPNNTVPNSMSMEYNWLTFNGKSGPATTPIVVRLGERVRIRVINLGMDHHPIHLHGMQFVITGHEGARLPEVQWMSRNTVLVAVAQAQDIEFVADNPGTWMFHCHLPHHMMNQMSSNVGKLTRLGTGMQAGAGMQAGMGIPLGGGATSEELAPSLGRGLGVGSTAEQAMSNGPLREQEGMAMGGGSSKPMHAMPNVAPNANQIPGFPQDVFMEGPMMSMDKMVEKPETYGLLPGWSGFSAGMMTLVRVLPPDQYDKIAQLKRRQSPGLEPSMPDRKGARI